MIRDLCSRRLTVAGLMFVGASAALCGCGSDDEPVEDPAEHACEHRALPGNTVAAASDRASAPTIAIGDDPYTVTPSSATPTYLRVAVSGDTAALLFVGTADVVSGLYEGDAAVALPTAAPNEFCGTDIPEHFDLDFHEAGDWFIELGPSAAPSVWLMLTEATGHAHEELVLSPDPPAAR